MSDFATPWTAACKASLSFIIAWSLLMPIVSMMQSNHLIHCCPFSSCPQVLPASGTFLMSQLFVSGIQSIEASASVLPMTIQRWFPLGLTSLILLSKGSSRVLSSTIILFISSHKKNIFKGCFIKWDSPEDSLRNTNLNTKNVNNYTMRYNYYISKKVSFSFYL